MSNFLNARIWPASRRHVFACLLILTLHSGQSWASVVVFTDARFPTSAASAAITVRLDNVERIEALLSQQFAADPSLANSLASFELGPELHREMVEAHQAIADAWSLGVTKVPAIVVDDKYVIYGEKNVQRAMDRIDEFRRARP